MSSEGGETGSADALADLIIQNYRKLNIYHFLYLFCLSKSFSYQTMLANLNITFFK